MPSIEAERQAFTLTLRGLCANKMLPKGVECQLHVPYDRQGVLLTLWKMCMTWRYYEVKHPRDWWQAFKARWYPTWALRRWPVQWTVWEARAYWPEAPCPPLNGELFVSWDKQPEED